MMPKRILIGLSLATLIPIAVAAGSTAASFPLRDAWDGAAVLLLVAIAIAGISWQPDDHAG